MKIKIIDDMIPDDLVFIYSKYFLEMPHRLREYSSNGENYNLPNAHLSYDIENNYFTAVLQENISKQICDFTGVDLDQIDIYRFHTNMQFPDVGGKEYHKDGTFCTAVLNLSNTDGSFEYVDGGIKKTIEDKFNRLVIFSDAEMMHRGIPPSTNENGPRLTIALKVFLNNPNN